MNVPPENQADDGDAGHVCPDPEPRHCLSERERARRHDERLNRVLPRERLEPKAESSAAEHPSDDMRAMGAHDERTDQCIAKYHETNPKIRQADSSIETRLEHDTDAGENRVHDHARPREPTSA